MKPAIWAVDPGDVTQNWCLFGSSRDFMRCGDGTIEEWEQELLQLKEHYSKKAGIICILENYVMYPNVVKLYQPFLTSENLGVMKWILKRENIPYELQSAGQVQIISDDYLKNRNLYIKGNKHYNMCLKHAVLAMKRGI